MKVITIGRDATNDIIINDPLVSRHHLQIIEEEGGQYHVVDFGSTNGTFVNGTKITGELRIDAESVIRIGNTTLPWQMYLKNTSEAKVIENIPVTSGEEISTTPDSHISRHGFVTFWLMLGIIGGILGIIGYIGLAMTSNLSPVMALTSSLAGLIVILGYVELLKCQKTGFWIAIIAAAISPIQLLFCHITQIITDSTSLIAGVIGAVISPVILYGILNLKKNGVSTWNNLRYDSTTTRKVLPYALVLIPIALLEFSPVLFYKDSQIETNALEISVPSSFREQVVPGNSRLFFDKTRLRYFQILEEDKTLVNYAAEISNLDEYIAYSNNSRGVDIDESINTTINEYPAVMQNYSAGFTGTHSYFLHSYVETPDAYIQILEWGPCKWSHKHMGKEYSKIISTLNIH